MQMQYLQDPQGSVHGFDISDPSQVAMIEQLGAGAWTNITANWPPAQTNAQAFQAAANTLAAAYAADLSELQLAWLSAAMIGGTQQASTQADIISELSTRKAQYTSDLAALKTKYGV